MEPPLALPVVPIAGKATQSIDPKVLKRMKKKLDELNKKIRHSKRKHNGIIHKRNSLKKAIEEFRAAWPKGLKSKMKGEPKEPDFTFTELEIAFSREYRSYRADGRPRMDPDTFFSSIREGLIKLIIRELKDLRSARVQTMTWIRFRQDENLVELAFNRRMTEVYTGSDLESINDGMINHMKTRIENPALLNSRFVFDDVLFLDVNFHRLNLMRGGSYLPLPEFTANKKAIINP